jgi:hypothetical protein
MCQDQTAKSDAAHDAAHHTVHPAVPTDYVKMLHNHGITTFPTRPPCDPLLPALMTGGGAITVAVMEGHGRNWRRSEGLPPEPKRGNRTSRAGAGGLPRHLTAHSAWLLACAKCKSGPGWPPTWNLKSDPSQTSKSNSHTYMSEPSYHAQRRPAVTAANFLAMRMLVFSFTRPLVRYNICQHNYNIN